MKYSILKQRTVQFAALSLITSIILKIIFELSWAFPLLFTLYVLLLCCFIKKVSLISALLLTFLSFFIITVSTYAACFFVGIEIKSETLLVVYSVLVGAVLYGQRNITHTIKVTKQSIVVSCIFIIGLCAIGLTILKPYQGLSTYEKVNYLSTGEDNVSHFALHNSIYSHGEFLYHEGDSGLISALQYYPQGLHAFMAANTMMVFGNEANPNRIMLSHIVQTVLFYVLLMAAIFIPMLRIVESLSEFKKYSRFGVSLLPIPLLFLTSFGALFYLYTYGFHSQIFAYLIILAGTIPFIEKWSVKSIISIYAGVIIGISYTWFLILPIVVASLGIYIIIKKYKPAKVHYLIYGISSILSSIPILQQFKVGGSGGIYLQGAVLQIDRTIFFTLFIFSILALVLLAAFFKKYPGSTILKILIAMTLVETVSIAILQLHKIQTLAYYYYKSEYLLLILFIIISLIATGCLIKNLQKEISRLSFRKYFIVLSSLILLIIISYNFSTSQDYPKAYLERQIAGNVDIQSVNLALSNNHKNILYDDTCYSFQKYISMRWSGALMLNDSDSRHTYLLGMLNEIPDENQDYFSKQKSEGATIIKYDQCAKTKDQ